MAVLVGEEATLPSPRPPQPQPTPRGAFTPPVGGESAVVVASSDGIARIPAVLTILAGLLVTASTLVVNRTFAASGRDDESDGLRATSLLLGLALTIGGFVLFVVAL